MRDTAGHPIVVGHDRSSPGTSALFYGHYDVQPVDPLDLWERPPFEPSIETRADGGKAIRARGASDDKGQLMTFVEACRAWKAVTGRLPLPLTVLLEGEEESGGANLPPFLEANAAELRADVALVCDTDMWDRDTPAITMSLRGLCGEEVVIHAADRDLHSGMYGSAAANPNHVLARIIADLHDADGRVTIPGFYHGVREPADAIRASWATLGFQDRAFLGEVGLSVPAGEKGRSALEMVWSRPTCEVNGMGGGYQGSGFKTVIPARASAKISFRLVFDQDPDAIRAAFRAFVEARLPADCRAEFGAHGTGRAVAFDTRAEAFPANPGRAVRRMGARGRLHRQRRVDPGGDTDPGPARHGRGDDGLRPARRPHPQPEREVRLAELPQGHPLLGAGARRALIRCSADLRRSGCQAPERQPNLGRSL